MHEVKLSTQEDHNLQELNRTVNVAVTISAVWKYDKFNLGASTQLLNIVYTL